MSRLYVNQKPSYMVLTDIIPSRQILSHLKSYIQEEFLSF